MAWAQLDRMQNLTFSYHREQVRRPHPALVDRVARGEIQLPEDVIAKPDFREFEHRFFYLDGQSRHEQRLSDEEIERLQGAGRSGYAELIQTYKPHKYEELVSRITGPVAPLGSIASPDVGSAPEATLDVALGIRIPSQSEPIARDLIYEAEFSQSDDGILRATFEDDGGLHTWEFDPDFGYALRCYERSNPETGAITRKIEVQSYDFRQGVAVPVGLVDETISHAFGTRAVIVRNELTVTDYKLDDPMNTDELYSIAWPPGTTIWDRRTGLHLRANGDTTTTLAEEAIADQVIAQLDNSDWNTASIISEGAATGKPPETTIQTFAINGEATEPSQWPFRVWLGVGVAMLLGVVALLVLRRRTLLHTAS